ncbi:MAG: hypothetical protein KDK39_01705 [Leptospiraceae bacterium]|nr:hypothetical protein [Leptospiraceae bacterium]
MDELNNQAENPDELDTIGDAPLDGDGLEELDLAPMNGDDLEELDLGDELDPFDQLDGGELAPIELDDDLAEGSDELQIAADESFDTGAADFESDLQSEVLADTEEDPDTSNLNFDNSDLDEVDIDLEADSSSESDDSLANDDLARESDLSPGNDMGEFSSPDLDEFSGSEFDAFADDVVAGNQDYADDELSDAEFDNLDLGETDQEESATLSVDELQGVLETDTEELHAEADELATDAMALDDVEDENIALSADELDTIIANTDDTFFSDMDDADSLPEGIDPDDHQMELAPVDVESDFEDLEPIQPYGADELEADVDSADAGLPEDSIDLAMDDDDDEPISLSSDELDNILTDVDDAGLDLDSSAAALSDEADLPDLELEESPLALESAMDMDTGAEENNLSVSDEELSEVLLDESDTAQDAVMAVDDIPDNPNLGSLEIDEDEPIALTAEELGNIVSEVDMDDQALAGPGTVMEGDDDLMPVVDDGISNEFDAEDSEEIALNQDELGSILEDVSDEVLDADGLSVSDDLEAALDDTAATDLDEAGDESTFGDLDVDRDAMLINLDEYDESMEEAPAAVIGSDESLAESSPAEESLTAVSERVSAGEGLDRDEVRKMIGYLDRLFDQLPEDTIREFSRSEYFDLYKKIMTDLDI